MTRKTASVQISGVGSHQIDIEVLEPAIRERLVECIKKNGKISIIVGHGVVADPPDGGFAQKVD